MPEQISQMESIVLSLSELMEDSSVPRNVRTKLQEIITILKQENEASVKVHKALSQIDEIANDVNLQSYTRTQLWNVMSILEKL